MAIRNEFCRRNMGSDNFPVSKRHDLSLVRVMSKFSHVCCKTYICYLLGEGAKGEPTLANQVFTTE